MSRSSSRQPRRSYLSFFLWKDSYYRRACRMFCSNCVIKPPKKHIAMSQSSLVSFFFFVERSFSIGGSKEQFPHQYSQTTHSNVTVVASRASSFVSFFFLSLKGLLLSACRTNFATNIFKRHRATSRSTPREPCHVYLSLFVWKVCDHRHVRRMFCSNCVTNISKRLIAMSQSSFISSFFLSLKGLFLQACKACPTSIPERHFAQIVSPTPPNVT